MIMSKVKRKLKPKYKNILILLFILICLTTLSISIYNIVIWKIQSDKTHNQVEEIEKIVEVEEIPDNDNTEIIEQTEEDKSNPYWDYIKMNLINVDFSELKNINNQTKGWIQVNGTNINYPFVQADNNKYYLTHSFDKSDN